MCDSPAGTLAHQDTLSIVAVVLAGLADRRRRLLGRGTAADGRV
jgi:hypothetical protein